jgi:hypothetical protein
MHHILSGPLTPQRRYALILGAIVLVFIGYSIFWKVAADSMKNRFVNWAQNHSREDIKITYEGPEMRGYPFYFNMDLGHFTYVHEGHFRISSPALHITSRPWAPFRPLFKSKETSELELIDEKQVYKVESFKVRVVRPWIAPRNHRDTGLYLYVDLSGIGLDPSLKAGLGDAVQRLAFNAKIMGEVPDITEPASLAAWRDDGGTVELSKINLEWLPLTVQGDGTLTLDKDFQTLASFSANISGYHDTIDLLRDQGQIKPFPASLFKAALTLLEDPKAPADQPKTIKVPVNVQSSSLSVAGIGLMNW